MSTQKLTAKEAYAISDSVRTIRLKAQEQNALKLVEFILGDIAEAAKGGEWSVDLTQYGIKHEHEKDVVLRELRLLGYSIDVASGNRAWVSWMSPKTRTT